MTVVIPESEWRWFGHAGHFVAASRCRHHLHTRVGAYRISTVGDMRTERYGEKKQETLGCDRLYETFVFRITGECEQCDPPCGQGELDSWSEIDSLPANTAQEADENHLAMCRKYAAGGES